MSINIKDLSDTFRGYFEVILKLNPEKKYSEQVYSEFLAFLKHHKNVELDEATTTRLRKIIESQVQVYMPKPEILLDDYEHEPTWFTDRKTDFENGYWSKYRSYLINNNWENSVVESLDKDVLDNLMNYLGDPLAEATFSIRGLVMGDVQSGKTSNYIGLINKAADAGYKVIILLTGTTESLRKQTQIRVEEGFIGVDSTNNHLPVGVGRYISHPDKQLKTPISPTSRNSDFTGQLHGTMFSNLYSDNTPYIFVTKKHFSTLRKIRTILQNIEYDPERRQINLPLLVIDDEADNASINTNDKNLDPTSINREIRQLLNMFTKSNYVGFTATPFANIFIDPNSEHEMYEADLFPKDFIVSLYPPSSYIGPEKLFLTENKTIKLITDYNDSFPLIHKKDIDVTTFFRSLFDAIDTFLIANAIRDLNDYDMKNSHRSMMINVTRFIDVQEKILRIVEEYLKTMKSLLNNAAYAPIEKAEKNPRIARMKQIFIREYEEDTSYTWEEVFRIIYDSIKDIECYKVPTSSKKKLDYQKSEETGLRAIVVGGLSLSRGLTLEGLMVSYLYRSTATFDVLMQMGRWFGYRNKPQDYSNLTRVWMLESTKRYFRDITGSISQLKDDFALLIKSKKKPQEFGIRVRNTSEELGITNPNKMRAAKKFIKYSSLFGNYKETPFISAKPDITLHNMNVTIDFLNKIDAQYEKDKITKYDVPKEEIISFLEKYKVLEPNSFEYLDKNSMLTFIRRYIDSAFDVAVISGEGSKVKIGDYLIDSVARSFDDIIIGIIRTNRRRLGSPSDPRFGLTKKQIAALPFKKSTKDFLIEGRKPLLMIYPLEYKFDELKNSSSDYKMIEYLREENLIPIGISIAFPRNSSVMIHESETYVVAINTQWTELMRERDNEEDEK